MSEDMAADLWLTTGLTKVDAIDAWVHYNHARAAVHRQVLAVRVSSIITMSRFRDLSLNGSMTRSKSFCEIISSLAALRKESDLALALTSAFLGCQRSHFSRKLGETGMLQ